MTEDQVKQWRVSRDESLNLMQCFMHAMHVCLGQFWVQEQQWCWWRWSMKEKCLWFSRRNVCNMRRREAGNVEIVLREREEDDRRESAGGISGIKKRDQEEGGMMPFLFFSLPHCLLHSLPHCLPHSLPSSASSLPVFDHKLMERVSKTGRDRQFDSGETKEKKSESMTTVFVLSFDNNSFQPEKYLPPSFLLQRKGDITCFVRLQESVGDLFFFCIHSNEQWFSKLMYNINSVGDDDEDENENEENEGSVLVPQKLMRFLRLLFFPFFLLLRICSDWNSFLSCLLSQTHRLLFQSVILYRSHTGFVLKGWILYYIWVIGHPPADSIPGREGSTPGRTVCPSWLWWTGWSPGYGTDPWS